MNKSGALLAACFLGLTLTSCTYSKNSTEGSAQTSANTGSSIVTDAPDAGSSTVPESSTPEVTPNTGSATVQSDPNTHVYRDCVITILDYSLHLDIDSEPAIRIQYQFTNNSKKATSFSTMAIPHAYQDTDTQQELRYTSPADTDEEYSAMLTLVEPGESIVCAGYFKLFSTDLPVNLKITDLRDSSVEMLCRTLDIVGMTIEESEEIEEVEEKTPESSSEDLFPSKKKKK